MSETLQKIMNESMNLTPLERVLLVDVLYDTFKDERESRITQLWAIEAEDRLTAFNGGKLEAEEYESVKQIIE